MEITNSLANNVATGDAANSSAKLAENFDTFLALLTTQLRFQDPLEPLESNEFVSQLVDFTNVEQSISTNKNLEKLIQAQSATEMASALGYIGKTVEAATDQVPFAGEDVEITYALASTATQATMVITDASGDVVFSTPAETATGKHRFTWDGSGLTGSTLPEGVYKVSVVAKNSDDAAITAATGVVARVTGVDTTDSGFVLSLGKAKVSTSDIISVRETVG